MEIEVMTWNTACSPTMYNRLQRKKKLHRTLENYSNRIDIIALQEMGSFRVGPLSHYISRRFHKIFEKSSFLAMIWDYVMIAEGFILPTKIYDNQTETIEFAKSIGYEYAVSCPLPRYYLSSGLIILSKFPIHESQILHAKSDLITRPGTIISHMTIGSKIVQVSNSYLVPTLQTPKPTYLLRNTISLLTRRSPRKLRKQQIETIRKNMNPTSCIVVGDFNIRRTSREYQHLISALDVTTTMDRKTGTIRGIFTKQIDYILVSEGITSKSCNIEDIKGVSDHHPLIARLSIN